MRILDSSWKQTCVENFDFIFTMILFIDQDRDDEISHDRMETQYHQYRNTNFNILTLTYWVIQNYMLVARWRTECGRGMERVLCPSPM